MKLPSVNYIDYCTMKLWEGQIEMAEKEKLRVKCPEHYRFGTDRPQKFVNGNSFVNVIFHPVDYRDRVSDAFWDVKGEHTYRPSGDLFIELFCSRTSEITLVEEPLIRRLKELLDATDPKFSSFPHALFDRWDIIINDPSEMRDEEPPHHARFRLNSGRLVLSGLYSYDQGVPSRQKRIDDEGDGDQFVNGWGYPNLGTLLASPDFGNPRSIFTKTIYLNDNSESIPLLSMRHRPDRVIGVFLDSFSNMAKNMADGIYDVHNIRNPLTDPLE